LAYDFWWHLGCDTIITSEWGTPKTFENGLVAGVLLNSGYGHSAHMRDRRSRRHQQVLDLGKEHQLVFEVRPAHDAAKAYGFVGVVVSLKDLSSSIWAPLERQVGNQEGHRDSRGAGQPGAVALDVEGLQGRSTFCD
jgi:selenium-binding protein 1